MPDPELRDLVSAAQARSEAFMQSSRQQMFQSFQEQRAVGVGAPAGMRSAIGAGDADKPMAGTPAGRLMDTITGLVRRGAAFGAGAAGGAAQPVFAGGAAGVGAVAAGGAYLAGESPFGPAGIAGGTITDMSRRMGFFQTAFAAQGAGLPFGLGRYAAQRADMEVHQAREMAQEDLRDRFVGGARRGGFAALNLLSFGLLNYGMRREGLTLQYGRTEQFARHIQNQFRFMTREDLRVAGMGEYAGPFATGITREGARKISDPMARELGQLEAETGMSPEELMTLQARGMGTLGITQQRRILREGGPAAMARTGRRVAEGALEVQRGLHLAEEEAKQFWDAMGQMHGSMDRIVGMKNEARRRAGQWGMNVRQVFDAMRGFETMGMQMGLGQGEMREVGVGYMGAMREQQRLGIMTRQELMRYGGQTEEEALVIQTRMRMQRGIGMYEQGRLGGLGMLMTQDRPAYMQFMTGRMDPMEVAGAVGGVMAQNPLARARARYDPATRRMAAGLGELTQFRATMAMQRGGMFFLGDRETEMIQDYQRRTGFDDMTAAQEFRRFTREREMVTRMARKSFGPGNDQQRGHAIQGISHRLMAGGLGELARGVTGESDIYGASVELYRMMGGERGEYDANVSIEEALRMTMLKEGEGPGDVAREMLEAAPEFTELVGKGFARARKEIQAGGLMGQFLGPLRRRTDDPAALGKVLFGRDTFQIQAQFQVRPAGKLRRIFGTGESRNQGVYFAINEAGRFRISSAGKAEEDVSYGNVQKAVHRLLTRTTGGLGATHLNAAAMDVARRFYSRFGEVAEKLGSPEELTRRIREVGIPSPQERAYQGFLMRKYGAFAQTVFGDLEGPGRTFEEFAGEMAEVEAEGSEEAMRRLEARGGVGVGFARAYAYTEEGGFRLQKEGLSRLQDVFGGRAKDLAGILERGGDFGWDVGKISAAMKPGGARRAELETALENKHVVLEVLRHTLSGMEAEKLADPLGSTPARRMYVEITNPEMLKKTS